VKKFALLLLLLTALAGGLWLWLRGPIAETTTAALRAYPVYSFARTRNETLLGAQHRGATGGNRLIHRTELAGPRSRNVTTPNNDTLYSWAFLDLSAGPVTLTVPALPGRYHSVALMDPRTDNVFVAGTRDGGAGGEMTIRFGDGVQGRRPPVGTISGSYTSTAPEAWLLIRTLVDGPADLAAARAAQAGFRLEVPDTSARPDRPARLLPVLPDPATLLANANPLIRESPTLQDPALARTGYGLGDDAFETLPGWRQWLWRLLLPRIFERMKAGIAEGSRVTDDGWSKSPPGIGTAAAGDAVRAAVALGGLGALPVDEAVYWTATLDRDRADLDGGKGRYRLTIPADVPAAAFWSLSIYERLPDGRLFFIENPLDRYAVGNRTPGLKPNADGSLTLTLAAEPPDDPANWLPAPRGPFTLTFRAYLPKPPLKDGRWRLPAVEKLVEKSGEKPS
jgi:hypothetical protein